MDKVTIQKITKFKGDIRSAFDFIMDVYDGLGFTVKTDLTTISNPFETFSNTIRNYRSRGLISPVEKSGVKLILNGRNLLQYLLIQRLLAQGARIAQLVDIVPSLDNKKLTRLIQKKSLVLTDIPGLATKTKMRLTPTGDTVSSSIPVWYHIKVGTGVQLHINANQYTLDEVNKIRSAVRSAMDDLE